MVKRGMQKTHRISRPNIVSYATGAAWLNWLLIVVITVATTTRPQLLGVSLPTLGTQALLVLGIGWGSNVARMSFFIWSIFGIILGATGGGTGSDGSLLATWGSLLSDGLMVLTLVGLLVPSANRWFLAQRAQNKAASAREKLLRAKRNMKVAAAWLLVFPVSALVAIPLNTPLLAVLVSCGVALCVGSTLLIRQGLKLYRLRELTPAPASA